jgi:hypothetical protein
MRGVMSRRTRRWFTALVVALGGCAQGARPGGFVDDTSVCPLSGRNCGDASAGPIEGPSPDAAVFQPDDSSVPQGDGGSGDGAKGEGASDSGNDGSRASDAPTSEGAPDDGATGEAASPFDGATGNPCAHVPSADNGAFCGTSTQLGFDPSKADPSTLYVCQNGLVASSTFCANGCYVADAGTPDGCK